MKSKRLILCLLGLCGWFVAVQAQTVALKTDLVNWATASLTLEPEVKVGRKSTMALGLSWNPWTFSDNKKWRHLRVQPEYRYWICRPFGGHFLGLHASYTRFNAGGVNLPFGLWPKLEDQRVQGNEWAVGLSRLLSRTNVVPTYKTFRKISRTVTKRFPVIWNRVII